MPIKDGVRGRAMGRRVIRTAEAGGVDPAGLHVLAHVHDRARVWREARLDDDHDPHYLHPGRTALILLLDTSENRTAVLAAAMLTESHRPDLETPAADVLAGADDSWLSSLETSLRLRERIPRSDASDRVERLVTAPPEVLLVATAERLDHARHAHMWLEGREDRSYLAEVESDWIGLSERAHPRLAARFRRWARGAKARR